MEETPMHSRTDTRNADEGNADTTEAVATGIASTEWSIVLKLSTWGGGFGGLVFGDTVLHTPLGVNLGLCLLGAVFGHLIGLALEDIFGW